MIFGLCMIFLMLGLLFSSFDIFLPAYPPEMLILIIALRIFGLMFSFLGLIILGMRIIQSDTGMYIDLPNSRTVNLIHSHVRGTDCDARFLKAKRLDLETIRCKNKLFKDVGGGFRINGHSCRRTYETIGFTVPDWLGEYFHDVKRVYGLKNSDEFKELKTKLSVLTNPKDAPFKSIEEQLNEITLLKPIMTNPEKKKVLLDMDFKQLKNLEMLFYDGITHNGDEVELFIDSATPNEIDVLESQTFNNEMERVRRYRDKGQTDWGRWMPWIIIAMFVMVILVMIIKNW